VIVAMVAVRVVQMAADEVAGMIAVGQGRVTAVGAVGMVLGVLVPTMTWRATGGVDTGHPQDVLIHVAAMNVVQVPVVEIIRVAVVDHSEVAAAGLVPVGVSLIVGAVTLTAEAGKRENCGESE
jgi:hypothetical protein